MQYHIHTKNYSILDKEEIERAYILMDSDNTNAYGRVDLIEKLNYLKSENIEVTKIYKTRKTDAMSENVTERYKKYI